MHQFTGKVIFLLVVVSFFLGLLVVTLKPDYTIESNIRSNRAYYPSVKVHSGADDTEGGDPQEEISAQGY